MQKMNDTYIVKTFLNSLAIAVGQRCNQAVIASDDEMTCKVFQPLENEFAPKKALAVRLFNMKFPQGNISILSGAPFGHRQQCRRLHLECLCQNHQFGIRDTAQLRFNFGERAATQIPTEKRATGGKHSLRHLLLITQLANLRADNVLRFGHAPKMELDTTWRRGLNCSVFGAICPTETATPTKSCKIITRQKRTAEKTVAKQISLETAPNDFHPIVTGAPCARLENKSH